MGTVSVADDIANDGGMIFGSQVVEIGSQVYAADDIDISIPVTEITRKDHLGRENADVLVKGAFSGSATLQIESDATPIPEMGDTFTIEAWDGTKFHCKVKEVGIRWGSEAETKLPITFKKHHAAYQEEE